MAACFCRELFTCLQEFVHVNGNLMNKLSLVGMQLPEKYKGIFFVSSEGPSSPFRLELY